MFVDPTTHQRSSTIMILAWIMAGWYSINFSAGFQKIAICSATGAARHAVITMLAGKKNLHADMALPYRANQFLLKL